MSEEKFVYILRRLFVLVWTFEKLGAMRRRELDGAATAN